MSVCIIKYKNISLYRRGKVFLLNKLGINPSKVPVLVGWTHLSDVKNLMYSYSMAVGL